MGFVLSMVRMDEKATPIAVMPAPSCACRASLEVSFFKEVLDRTLLISGLTRGGWSESQLAGTGYFLTSSSLTSFSKEFLRLLFHLVERAS